MAAHADYIAAAFRRLCVETILAKEAEAVLNQPPSGGCVLKLSKLASIALLTPQPPSGGCVLKQLRASLAVAVGDSRLQAAVC